MRDIERDKFYDELKDSIERRDLGSFFSHRRSDLGLSLEEAAENLGVSKGVLSRFEVGASPNNIGRRFPGMLFFRYLGLVSPLPPEVYSEWIVERFSSKNPQFRAHLAQLRKGVQTLIDLIDSKK